MLRKFEGSFDISSRNFPSTMLYVTCSVIESHASLTNAQFWYRKAEGFGLGEKMNFTFPSLALVSLILPRLHFYCGCCVVRNLLLMFSLICSTSYDMLWSKEKGCYP